MSAATVLHVQTDDKVVAAITCNACHFDNRLSWKAVGILWYLLSHPDGWRFYRADLISRHTDGKDAVQTGLRELRDYGYLKTVASKGTAGTFDGQSWYISGVPLTEEDWQTAIGRLTENPVDGNGTERVDRKDGRSAGRETRPTIEKSINTSCLQGDKNGELFPEARDPDEFVIEVGQFCIRLGVVWKLKAAIEDWCLGIRREARYAGVDFAYETRKCGEWYEGRRKKPKSPDRALRKWFENAARFAAADQEKRIRDREESTSAPDWVDELGDEWDG